MQNRRAVPLTGIVGFLAICIGSIFMFPAGHLDSVSQNVRQGYLRKAKVWRERDVRRMNIIAGPVNDVEVSPESEVRCSFVEPHDYAGGASPKFQCRITDTNEIVRVKFRRRETFGEIAGSRLLWALGFYSDENYPVRLRCLDCPMEDPSSPSKSDRRGEVFLTDSIIERDFPGEEIAEFHDQGWTWDELNAVDPDSGGSSRAEVDALKLLAVFLQHTDSKHQQQRLACYDQDIHRYGSFETCSQPVLMIQDVGATFGASGKVVSSESSMYLRGWESKPVWNYEKEIAYMKRNSGKKTCIGNLTSAFADGLSDPEISEAGRIFLADLLNQLTDEQILNLFLVARANQTGEYTYKNGRKIPVTVDDWLRVFKQKRQEINEHRCH